MKNSIRLSLNLIISYFCVYIVLFTLIGAVLYMVYSMCSTLVAGQGFSPFSMHYFVKGILLSAPVVITINSAFMAFYFIRHSEFSKFQLIVYGIFYLLVWILMMPGILSLNGSHKMKDAAAQDGNTLSPGYFREYDQYVFYYSKVDSHNVASGVCIDKKAGRDGVYVFKDVKLSRERNGFTDSLIQESIDIPIGIKFIVSTISRYSSIIQVEFSKGFFRWICFCTLGLALFSVIFLRNVTEWRLVNVVLIFFMMFVVIFINIRALYPFGAVHDVFASVNDKISFIPRKFNFFLVFVNLLVFSGLLVTGILIDNAGGNYVDYEEDDAE